MVRPPFRIVDTFVQRNMKDLDTTLGDCLTLSALLADVMADNAGDRGIRPYRHRQLQALSPASGYSIYLSGEATSRLPRSLCTAL